MFKEKSNSSVGDYGNLRKRPTQEESGGESSSIFKRRGTQTAINFIFKKIEREDAC